MLSLNVLNLRFSLVGKNTGETTLFFLQYFYVLNKVQCAIEINSFKVRNVFYKIPAHFKIYFICNSGFFKINKFSFVSVKGQLVFNQAIVYVMQFSAQHVIVPFV